MRLLAPCAPPFFRGLRRSQTCRPPPPLAAGSPEVAGRALQLLRAAGIPCDEDNKRGFDHGVFVPLLLAYPKADIPVVQVRHLGL